LSAYKSQGGGRLFIFGAGGHGREVAWLAQEVLGKVAVYSFLVDKREYLLDSVNGVPVQLLCDIKVGEADQFVVALGDPSLRRKATKNCLMAGLFPTTLVHPRVEMSSFAEIGAGSVICAGSIITTNVVLGNHVHVNVGCTISHDVRIGDFATLSPGVHVSGNVEIGAGAFIGTGANIINGKSGQPLLIGEGAVVAAGACVTKTVEAGALVAGVPAMRKR
jgi:sugar O-acyltransferase (sialic acid O-acetyltransferase NeuD family)